MRKSINIGCIPLLYAETTIFDIIEILHIRYCIATVVVQNTHDNSKNFHKNMDFSLLQQLRFI